MKTKNHSHIETHKIGMKQNFTTTECNILREEETNQRKRRRDKPTFKNKACKRMLKKDWDFQRTNKEDHGP